MADDIQYSSGGELVNNKRKYEVDQSPPPPPRRVTGFSAPIASQSPDSAPLQPSYNTVLPIVDGVELAKQKAQEIANRLYSNVDQKRPRVENGGGFDSMDGGGNKPVVPMMTPPQQASSYNNYQGTSKKIEIPNGRVGVIIGKAGETIKYLQMQSGAKIQVTRDVDADPNSGSRVVEVMGSPDQIAKAEQLIHEVINEADKGGSGVVSRRVNVQQPGADQFVMQVPNNKVGLVIGKGGESIKNMQARSGARIQVIPLHLPPGDTSTERTVQIDGTPEQIEAAKQLVIEVTSENRSRNSGGYQQGGGYQARPQSSWGGPPSMQQQQQQPGYGYMQQPGAYPGGPSPQYNMSQASYSQYPQQTSYGAAGWDQSSAPQNQAGSQGGNYDYYNQQTQQQQQVSGGQPGGPADASAGYGYGQAPTAASGYGQQAYTHDGYGGYHTQSGYEQQQQGYNSAPPAYGNGGGGQVDASQAPPPAGTQPPANPNPNPASYPAPQGSATAAAAAPAQGGGYGIPTPQAAAGGYGTQPGYGYGPPQGQKGVPGQSGYGQSPSGAAAAQVGGYGQGYPPQAGYGAAQSGYGSAAYGAAQAGYGQQQPAAAYNSSYGGAGSQPPAYGGDGTGGGATPQPPAQGGAKPSPKS
ncbi:far upstream element-binding protein 2 [Impatiens glandulifera]|uniref:far upstream element-binding protein 2 n=1 Tax=Impatiens glandulifera TaxID=253017 RepID=UPI001FB1277C|nr:far upstream element-binding protein 2 [Impatiens glandulifera]